MQQNVAFTISRPKFQQYIYHYGQIYSEHSGILARPISRDPIDRTHCAYTKKLHYSHSNLVLLGIRSLRRCFSRPLNQTAFNQMPNISFAIQIIIYVHNRSNILWEILDFIFSLTSVRSYKANIFVPQIKIHQLTANLLYCIVDNCHCK